MKATVFVNIAYGVVVGKSFASTVEADSAEKCLTDLQDQLRKLINYTPTLTFRPKDGMIFWGEMSSTTPIGVIYREGYLTQ
jgi:hypothetical protein